MTFTPGTMLGPYEIVGHLGTGGMGEVYRARDSKLKREVAIKVLPDAFSNDSERVARFQREAEFLASFNHPHIAAIYDVAQEGPARFLVLELVEGETLAERVAVGPVPLSEALDIATQITEALEAAHEKGVIHRDLKPANIKRTGDGHIKVLDFGLAKMREAKAPDLSSATTVMSSSTPGMILGTPAYMPPEQITGKATDGTADVWAFGCVLFEMLSGRPVFQGETTGEILAAVLKVEPDWGRLPDDTPEGVRRLLRRCLDKNPKNRLQHIGDARIEIADVMVGVLTGSRPMQNPSRRNERLAWITLLGLIVAAAVLWTSQPVPSADELRFEIVTPPTTDPLSVAISPDGKRFVFTGTSQGRSQLWLRALNSDANQPLAGTDGASGPFWSPDSRSVGFFADGRLKRVNIDGGAPQTLANASNGVGGTWNRDDIILFVPVPGTPVYSVSAAGGNPVAVTQLTPQQDSHGFPFFLPDGRHFLYQAYAGNPDFSGSYVGQLDGSETRRVVSTDTPAAYVRGHLFFGRQGMLLAQAFDPDRLAASGNSFPVGPYNGTAAPSVSASAAAIVYRTGPGGNALRQLVWVDRSGNKIESVGDALPSVGSAELSPDGRRVVTHRSKEGNFDVWLLDTARKVFNPLTDSPAVDAFPIWSPTGTEIVYWSNKRQSTKPNQILTAGALYRRSAAGGGNEEFLYADGPPVDWSRDGNFLLYRSQIAGMGWDLLALPLQGERKPIPVVQTDADEREGQFSPDGKWIAYQSNRSGRFEIYLQPFPSGNFIPVSTNGGAQVRWRRDGKELFYIARDGMLMSVPIRPGQTLEPDMPVPLFQTHVGGALQFIDRQAYMASSDGQRFLMNTVAEELNTSSLSVILNWKSSR